jgi:integrase
MMSKNRFKFTDERIRNLQNDSGKRVYYYDEDPKNLRLSVTPAGTKTFQYQAWSSEKQRPITLTIGKWPTYPLAKAREKVIALQAEVNDGKDPELDKKQRRETLCLNEIFDLYITEHAIPHKRSVRDDQTFFRLHLKPAFGVRRPNELNPDMVRSWHVGLTKKMQPSSANRMLALLRSVFNIMLQDMLNPCRGVKLFKEYSRDRFLQPHEVGLFFEAIEKEREVGNPDMADYFLMCIFTGARRSNVLALRWSDIDFTLNQWRITGKDSKNKDIMIVPLVDEALEILRRRKSMASSVFVFPSHGKTGHLQEPRKGWERIKKYAGLENTDTRIHDLRRTMGSYQTIGGASTAIVGKTLGHKNPASTAVYARMHLDPVREAMEKAVALMKTPVERKVVNIKK